MEWVASLGAFTPELCDSYVDKLSGAPIAQCDQCNKPVMYRVSCHGCTSSLVCGMHRQIHVNTINALIRSNGHIVCPICELAFGTQEAMIQWYLI